MFNKLSLTFKPMKISFQSDHVEAASSSTLWFWVQWVVWSLHRPATFLCGQTDAVFPWISRSSTKTSLPRRVTTMICAITAYVYQTYWNYFLSTNENTTDNKYSYFKRIITIFIHAFITCRLIFSSSICWIVNDCLFFERLQNYW